MRDELLERSKRCNDELRHLIHGTAVAEPGPWAVLGVESGAGWPDHVTDVSFADRQYFMVPATLTFHEALALAGAGRADRGFVRAAAGDALRLVRGAGGELLALGVSETEGLLDRADALVWALTALMTGGEGPRVRSFDFDLCPRGLTGR
jgi:hypothetical protein